MSGKKSRALRKMFKSPGRGRALSWGRRKGVMTCGLEASPERRAYQQAKRLLGGHKKTSRRRGAPRARFWSK